MGNSEQFAFRQFVVRQDLCAMKVGTDGVLLGAWAEGGRRVLDIGTGTGLVALMMAQRFAGASVVAVDLDEGACRQAAINVGASPFASRVSVVRTAVQDFEAPETFDSIVSNPPFFTSALRCPDQARNMARHADTLSYADLFAAVDRLLAAEGTFSAIVPTDCLSDFTAEAYVHGLSPVRRTLIRTTQRKQPKRALLAFRRAPSPMACEEVCLVGEDGGRSAWYGGLTAEFYLR